MLSDSRKQMTSFFFVGFPTLLANLKWILMNEAIVQNSQDEHRHQPSLISESTGI